MDLALIVLLASFAAALGGRAQFTVARLGSLLGRSTGLLLAGLATSALSAMALAHAGAWLASEFGGASQPWLIGGALILAAAELAWPVRIATPAEPTRSLGAITLVLLARQLFDAPRWFAFAGGAAFGSGWQAGLGAAIGGGATLLLAWLFPSRVATGISLRSLRWALAASSLLAASLIAFVI